VTLGAPYDETIVGWIGWDGAVTVDAVGSRCGANQSVIVGHLFHDDHGAPAILVEPDKRLTAFWSGHNGSAMYYRTTRAPGDVRAWGPVRTMPARVSGRLGFTYPNPVSLSREADRAYLFWRGADYSADFSVRSPSGAWGPARRMIVNPGQRPYVKVATDDRDTIAFAYTNGHPRETTTSIYYTAYRGGWLRHADGRRITRLGGRPIRPGRGDLVYDGARSHASSWVWDVALDSGRRPVIVYATFRDLRDHAYWYARWTGRRWRSHLITLGGPTISPGTIETEYSGGLTLDHRDPSIVYLSREVRGRFELERWVTPDGGSRWHHVTVARSANADSVRPVVPRGPAGPVKVLWLRGRYRSYTTYRTSVAYRR
jgi:BNR repeat-containing family member